MKIRNRFIYLWGVLGIVLMLYPVYTLYMNSGFFVSKVNDVEYILAELVIWTFIMLVGYKKRNTI